MNVSLTTELEQLVREKVQSGRYHNASEVITEGLRLLKERDEFEALRGDVRSGFEAIERGEYVEYDEHTIRDLTEDVKKRGLKRLSEKQTKTGTR